MNIEAVSVALDDLKAAWNRKQATNDAYDKLCHEVAAKAALDPVVLKQYVNAVMNERVERTERKTEQMSLLLELDS